MIVPDRSDKKAFAEYVANVMKGWAEGGKLEVCKIGFDFWQAVPGTPFWNWHVQDYRLAPEAPAVESWTFETVPNNPRVRRISDGKLFRVAEFPNGVRLADEAWADSAFAISYDRLALEYKQLNGDPCGTVKAGDWPKT